MTEQNTGWRDISTAPYDEVVLFYTHDGNIVRDFMYDCGTKEMARFYTHWQPLPPPPDEDAAEYRNQVIQELMEKVPEGLWGFSPSEQEAVSEWLKDQMAGE